MENINPETGESMAVGGRSPRFMYWSCFLVFSVITMGSAVQVKNKSEPVTSANRYAVICSVVTFLTTLAVVVAHMVPMAAAMLVGTKIEGITVVVLVALWSAIVAVNTQAGDGLAVPEDGSNVVQNANLYYFSWAGFVTAIVLCVDCLKNVFGLDMVAHATNNASKRLHWWASALAASIVVLGSAIRTKKMDCGPNAESDLAAGYCGKTSFAIACGTLGSFCAIVILASKLIQYTNTTPLTPQVVEFGGSIFLAVLSAFNVAYTTSAGGPGSAIGNLYYFSWIMFLTTAVALMEVYGEYFAPPSEGDGTNGTNGTTTTNGNTDTYADGGEVQVETFDDAI